MKDLNTATWKEFEFSKLFKIGKGFYNTKPIEAENGEIPFIGASASNNGITSWHNIEDIEAAPKAGKDAKNQPLEDKLFEGNCICVTNNGSVGYAYYQESKFTCSHDVNPLYPNPDMGWTMNRYNALFLCTVIEQERFRWAYGRKWRPVRMQNSVISLPITKDGNPDWKFMENYIKDVFREELERVQNLEPQGNTPDGFPSPFSIDKGLNPAAWKVFTFPELFKICNGFYNAKPVVDENGSIPFIGASAMNNGITSWHNVDDIEAAPKAGRNSKNQPLKDKIFEGNCICVTNDGSVGHAYYQESQFTCSHSVNVLYPNPHMGWKMNKYNALFLCSIIEQERFRWAYGRKWRPSRMIKSEISLPITKDGNPDWKFMENYIRSVFKEELERVQKLEF